jgi:hypothetical protein
MRSAIIFAAIAAASFTGCFFPNAIIHGSFETVTATSSEAGFTGVSVENACEATITRGDAYSVSVEINDNIEKHLNIENSNGTLYITLDNGHAYNNLTFKVTITMPVLESVSGSGASEIAVSGFDADNSLSVDLSGASKLSGDIGCADATFELSGASDVAITGSAGDISCDASGASTIDLRDFTCVDANIDLSGASDMRVNASGTISGKLSGASEVDYYGKPTVGSFNVSGASEVRRAN